MAVPDVPRALWRMLLLSTQQPDHMQWHREYFYDLDGYQYQVKIKYDFAGDYTRTMALGEVEKELVAKFEFYSSENAWYYKIYHLTLRTASNWPAGYNPPKYITPFFDERTTVKYPSHFNFKKRELYHHLMMLMLTTNAPG